MTLLSFLDQPPVPWARKGRYGEGGSFGLQIDASGAGLRNRVMHRELIPATADVSLHTRVRMKSSLVCSDDFQHGFAVRHRGFQLEGDIPAKTDRQVWDSVPYGKDAWIAGQHSDWITRSFLVEPPSGLGIDYVTWEGVVRADSGQVSLSAIECRHAFTRQIIIPDDFGLKEWSGSALQSQHLSNYERLVEDDAWHVRYIGAAIPIRASRGQEISISATSCLMGGDARELLSDGTAGPRDPAKVAVVAKLRRRDTKEGLYYIVQSGITDVGTMVSLQGGNSIRAEYDFDQIELLAAVRHATATFYAEPRLNINGLYMTGLVRDFVAPSR